MLHKGLSFDDISTKQIEDDLGEFSGVASTSDKDLADDIIEAGAFGTIQPKSIVMLRDHNPTCIIGGWKSFEQDGSKLKVEGKILLSDRCPKGQETYELLKHGFISGISVGFRVSNPQKNIVYDEVKGVRRIKAATLLECSIVSIPANPKARIGTVKSFERPDLVEWLSESGYASDDIEILMTRGFDALAGHAALATKQGTPPSSDPRGTEPKRSLIQAIDGHPARSTDDTIATELRSLLDLMRKGLSHV